MYWQVGDFPQNLDEVDRRDYYQHGQSYADLSRSTYLDEDGVPDQTDNCPGIPNANQANGDGDSRGDACDNCPMVPSSDYTNYDSDPQGTPCDNCPTTYNPTQSDYDGDGRPGTQPPPGARFGGDACDADDDNDDGLDTMEAHAGTGQMLACSADSVANNENPDARLADLNDDRQVTGFDLNAMAQESGKNVPPAAVRFDIAPDPAGDNAITGADLSRVAAVSGFQC